MDTGFKYCQYCGAPLAPNGRFCEACGQPVGSRQADAAPPELSGEKDQALQEPPAPPVKIQPPAPATPPGGSAQPLPEVYPSPALTPPIGPDTPMPPAPAKTGRSWVVPVIIGCVVLLCVCCLCLTAAALAIGLPFGAILNNPNYGPRFDLPSQEWPFDGGYPLEMTDIPIPAVPLLPEETLAPLEPTETAEPAGPLYPAEPPTTTAQPPTSVNYEGIFFTYDPAVFGSAVGTTIPAKSGIDMPPWDILPTYVQFTFTHYALTGSMHVAAISIYPVQEYEAINPMATQAIADMRRLVADKPPLGSVQSYPFLPVVNAAQMMRTQAIYQEFRNGSGIRFLTDYSQATLPVTNQDMFYTYQGLTQDGAYYVSAVLPVGNPILPPKESVVVDETFQNNFTTYLNNVQQQLNAQPPDSFIPSLAALDAVIQSLQVK